MVLIFRKLTVHQLCQLIASVIMGKSLNLFEFQLLQMLIHWQYLQENGISGLKGLTYVNLLRKGLFKYKCLLNIDVFHHMDTTKHLFHTDH